jgi:hypothetical protein
MQGVPILRASKGLAAAAAACCALAEQPMVSARRSSAARAGAASAARPPSPSRKAWKPLSRAIFTRSSWLIHGHTQSTQAKSSQDRNEYM